MKHASEIMFGYENLSEALITSYNMKSCEKYLKSIFPEVKAVINRNCSIYTAPMWNGEFSAPGDFELVLTSINRLLDLTKSVEEKFGWFPSILEINGFRFADFSRNGNFVCVSRAFEGLSLCEFVSLVLKWKFPDEMSLFVEARYTVETNNYSELYHATTTDLLDKIRKQGLVPKSRGNFPERVYFSMDRELCAEMMQPRYKHKLCLLRMNLNKYGDEIRSKYTFYVDPRIQDGFAVFTYDCIDPKYIEIYADGVWKSII